VHVLVATDGKLDPQGAARYAQRLAGEAGRITVLTVIEIPRRLLSDLRGVMGDQPAPRSTEMIEYVDQPSRGSGPPRSWPGDDAIIERYLADKRVEYTQPIIKEIDNPGLSANGVVVEGENAARTILERIDELGADVLIIGSHGQGLFQGFVGSTGTKLMRRASIPVLLLRN
jgi:nucleotide-binding universal stress UspA family protein